MKYIKNLLTLAVLSLVVALTPQVNAQATNGNTNTASFIWSASTSPNITNYSIYYGTSSRNYTNTVNFGVVTTGTISNLANGVTYYFALTVKDGWNLEGNYSPEVVVTIPRLKPITPIDFRLIGVNTNR